MLKSLAFAVGISLLLVQVAHCDVVFCALLEGDWRLMRSKDGKCEVIETKVSDDMSAPCWNKKTDDILFEANGNQVYRWDSKKKSATLLSGHRKRMAVRPSVSVDGLEIFVEFEVSGSGEDSEIVEWSAVDSKSRAFLRQTGPQDHPDFSPDGRWVVYSNGSVASGGKGGAQVVQNLWLFDRDTSGVKPLLLGEAEDVHPDWSPDGKRIAFASNRSGQFEIWVVGAEGAGLVKITDGGGAKEWPAWSPDGKSIMFTLKGEDGYALWSVDADGRNLRRYQPKGLPKGTQMRDADWK